MRSCTKCARRLPTDEFYRYGDKVQSWCKECMRAANRAKYQRDKVRINRRTADNYRARRLGLTYEEYMALPVDPGEQCSVCGCLPDDRRNGAWSNDGVDRRTKNLSIDHDHKTGKIRGFLCSHCNRALGLLDDNPEWCRALADYVSTGGLGWEPRPKLSTGRRPSSTCGHGHELDGHNLIILPTGERRCRECVNRRAREYSAKARARAKPEQK